MFVESEDNIVISGLAGRFPACDNVRQFQDGLFNKADLGTVDEREWIHDHPDVPQRTGRITNMEKFDADYFNIPFTEAHQMDPMSRMLLEHTCEAILDAGVNPKDLKGSRTGIFVSTCYSESEKTFVYEKPMEDGYGLIGCSRFGLANQISYWLDVKGPSYVIDTACSSSLFTMALAYRSIQTGECDAAIVASANLCLHYFITLQFARLGVLSSDGICRPFDEDARGYMRSETVAAVYLQKAKVAKRIYATFVYAKLNCDGYKEQGITYPSSEMQRTLLEEFYNECGISPTCLDYIEAHGTGTVVGDPEEVNAIERVFCKNRSTPLLIGSVKSNLGHSEPASGMCQITKVLISMETGMLLPNANFKRARKIIKAFTEGKIKVVTDLTPWDPGFVGINSFGFGGANCHILLRAHTKQKVNGGAPNDKLPRLIVMSGRTEEAIASFLNEIKSRPIDVEFVRLLHDIYADVIINHPYRGYAIIESETSTETIQEIRCYSDTRKPVCFVFSGIGSQWLGMGQALLQFPVFRKTIEKCDTILKTRGMRVIDILINKGEAALGNVLNSLVGITVMQIALIDLLMSVSITPDYAVGYSVGELCCGYLTGNFTIEQALLSAYYIGLALSETKIVHGAMAEIGLDSENVRNICPPDIEIIGSNGRHSCTISGPRESVTAFATNLQVVNNVSAKEIDCNNVPFHTHHLAPARPAILAYLKRVIPQTMAPSEIWRNTVHDAKLSYAEYFTDNLLTPVLFDEIARSIPGDAVALEIAPDAILRDVTAERFSASIALLRRNHEDNVKVFLQGIGQLYNCGLQPQVANLYPAVQFPVSRGTPMISSSIKWDHSEDWYLTNFRTQKKLSVGERLVELQLNDEDYEYMRSHVIDGRTLFPATGYLVLVWETIGMLTGQVLTEMPIVFENVRFVRATSFSKQALEFTVTLQKGSGNFEIVEGNNIVVTGRARVTQDIEKEKLPTYFLRDDDGDDKAEVMKSKDIYKELRLRGYQYTGLFRGIKSASTDGSRGHISWDANWATFMDCMLQMKILGTDTRCLYVPTQIEKLVIDPQFHMQFIRESPETIDRFYSVFPVRVYNDLDCVVAGGVEILGIKATAIFRRKSTAIPVIEECKFVAHRDRADVTLKESAILSTHLALECHQVTKVAIIELVEDGDEVTAEELLSPLFLETLGNLPLIQPNITFVPRCDRFSDIALPSNVAVSQSKTLTKDDNAIIIAGYDLLREDKRATLREIVPALKDGGFLLTREKSLAKNDITKAETLGLHVILEKRTSSREHIALLKKEIKSTRKTEVIHVDNYEFSWLQKLKSILNAQSQSINAAQIILVGQADSESGLLGLLNCLRKEPGGEAIRGMLIEDETAPKFSLHEPLYAEQLRLDLPINVLHPGKIWGSYRHLPLAPLAPRLVHHGIVNQLVRGDLTSLSWIQGNITPDCQDKDLIHIVYVSLNFKDIMISTGKIILDFMLSRGRLEECFIGLEYVGFDNAGRRVMGISENRCMANMHLPLVEFRWYVPDSWTLEDAATIPCAYGTIYYALMISEDLKKGEKILIHSGTGAVGQAAINVALHHGCEIFTTVGTPEKRKFIRDNFPSIPDDHIGNSRDTTFEQMIFRQTKGRGVDVVLNSLAEEKLQASVRCLAKHGRFLEIGKFDFMANNALNMSIFAKGIRFYSVMLDNLFTSSKEKKEWLNRILVDALATGAIKPISRKIYSKDEVESAFRYMAAGKHIGKVIIKIQDEDTFVPNKPVLALPRYYCLANRSYIILGGLGGFGLELADWLVIRGAMNLVLVSRTGIKNGYQQMKTEQWRSYGVKVSVVSNLDATDFDDCERILKTAEDLAPVDGIFNLAAALNDKIFLNHTVETFQEPFRAKAWATSHLDQLSRKICPRLRHFVVFSSVSCGRGNAGQSNYGMANSIMERICEKRVREGLHGLAIQWGAVGDVGLVADMQDNNKEMVIGGTLQQRITSCIEKLEEFLLQEKPVVASMVVAEKRSNALGGASIVETVANIMGLKDLKTVAHHTLLSELGMDSMMAVEIKQTLEREYDIFLSSHDIRNLNFAKLANFGSKEQSVKVIEKEDLMGLKLLVRIIGGKTLIPDICIDLQTKKSKTKKGPIFLLPGIEGGESVFNPLVSKIEGSATILQYNEYNIGSNCISISDIADCLFKELSSKNKLSQNFVLVGYSYGSCLALELAHRLERTNLQGRLVLIDGAPEQMKMLVVQHFPFTTENEFQDNILLNIVDSYLQPAISGKLLLELNKCQNWNEKLAAFLTSVPENDTYSIDYQAALCSTIYKRLIALHEYDVTRVPKIKSPITLLKPTIASATFDQEDYGLHKITQGDISIHYIEGNHFTILDSDNVIAAINGDIENIKSYLQANIINNNEIISVKDDRTRS